MDADYMQFKGVMDEVKKRLRACLEKGPATCYDAELILLGGNNGSPGGSSNAGSSGAGGLSNDNILCKGWMEKTPQETGGNFFKSAGRDKWQRRFFVLMRTSPVRAHTLSLSLRPSFQPWGQYWVGTKNRHGNSTSNVSNTFERLRLLACIFILFETCCCLAWTRASVHVLSGAFGAGVLQERRRRPKLGGSGRHVHQRPADFGPHCKSAAREHRDLH